VQVDCVADDDLLANITRGCESDSVAGDFLEGDTGEHLRAKRARLLRHGDKNSWLEITLDEGKNRQIRRLLEAQGVRVLRLVRVSIGPLELGDLKKGSVRPLTAQEKEEIDRAFP
jgi:23S rRNA pseudouridine2605 synthase